MSRTSGLIAVMFILSILGATLLSVQSVDARGGQGLKNYCAWYAQKARAAGRKGLTRQADAYWQQHSKCMRGWG